MTVIKINAIYSKVLPDENKLLKMPNDDNLYSQITCKHKVVKTITEVDAE